MQKLLTMAAAQEAVAALAFSADPVHHTVGYAMPCCIACPLDPARKPCL